MKFREKSISKLYAFAFAAVFALTLAGCGGGGGTADTTPDPPPMPDTSLADAQAAAQAAYNAAKAAVDAAAANRDSDSDSYDAALQALGAAEAANSAAQAATTTEAAEAAQANAEAARNNAVTYANMVNQAKADDDAVAAAAAAQAAHNKMVETKIKAISSEAGSMDRTNGQPFDDNDSQGDENDNYVVKISHKDGSVSIEIDDPEMPAKNDPQFTMSDGKYVRDNGGGVTEIISVMTDIEAPVDTAFGKVYKLTLNDGDEDRTGDQFTTYAVNNNNDIGKVASSKFPTLESTTSRFDADDPDTTDKNEGQFRGTFDGAEGTYECKDSSGCSVASDAKGKISSVTGTWEFTPDAGETVSVPDDNFMHYGFWIKKSEKDGVTTYDEVQTFAGHSMSETSNIAEVVDGSAKYEGGAHGVYTYNTFNADSSVDARSAGTFTADVALTAYFGAQSSVAQDKHNKLEGTVSNFELSGGEPNKWELTLRSSGNANISNSASFDDGVASVKGQANAGWSASFHGDGAAVTGNNGTLAPPPAVVGEFNGNFANGSVAGAYGATYQKD